MRRQALYLFTLVLTLVITGCSSQYKSEGSKEQVSWESIYEPFYTFDDLQNGEYLEEFREKATSKTGLYNFHIKYLNLYSESLEEVKKSFLKGKEIIETEDLPYLDEALLFLDLHLGGIDAEIKELTELIKLNCPESYSESQKSLLKRCDYAITANLNYQDVPLFCTFVKMSTNLRELPNFATEKVSLISARSKGDFDACRVFDQSHLLRGYPRTIGVGYVLPELQSISTANENRLVIEVAEGLYAYDSSANVLQDAINSSWFGNCAPYKVYESKLSEYNLILGSLKPGSCKN
jgi:hypothetical protein